MNLADAEEDPPKLQVGPLSDLVGNHVPGPSLAGVVGRFRKAIGQGIILCESELEKVFSVIAKNRLMVLLWNSFPNEVSINLHLAQRPVAAIQEAIWCSE